MRGYCRGPKTLYLPPLKRGVYCMLTIQDVYPVFGEVTKKILKKVLKMKRPTAANVSSHHFFFVCLYSLKFFLDIREVVMKLWTTWGREVPSTSFFFLHPPLLLVKKCSPSLTNGQKGWTHSWPTSNSYWELWLHFLGCFVKLDDLRSSSSDS